jgi:hypothetical protein
MLEKDRSFKNSANYLQTYFERLRSKGSLEKINTGIAYQYFRYDIPVVSSFTEEHHEVFAVKNNVIVFSREKEVTKWEEDDIATKTKWKVPGEFGVLEVKLDDEAQSEDDMYLEMILFPHNNKKTSWGAVYVPLPPPDNNTFKSYIAGNNTHHHIILMPNDPEFGNIKMNEEWFRNRGMNMRVGYVDNRRKFEVVFPEDINGANTIKTMLFKDPQNSIFEKDKGVDPWRYFIYRFGIKFSQIEKNIVEDDQK